MTDTPNTEEGAAMPMLTVEGDAAVEAVEHELLLHLPDMRNAEGVALCVVQRIARDVDEARYAFIQPERAQ